MLCIHKPQDFIRLIGLFSLSSNTFSGDRAPRRTMKEAFPIGRASFLKSVLSVIASFGFIKRVF